MNKQTVMILVGLGAAYLFLSTRTPVFAKQPDGSYLPAGILDKLTVALTGAQPPVAVPPMNASVNIPGVVDLQYAA